jgi:GDP-mannose 6-dehydrogenase
MNVTVFGLGYVGCVTAACLANSGHQVTGVDINEDKVQAINQGASPVVEPGLDELIREARQRGLLQATTEAGEGVLKGDILLVCVGTPSEPNGNHNYAYLDRVCGEIASGLRLAEDYRLIAFRSTILPGSLKAHLLPVLQQGSGRQAGEDFGVAVHPEFLREGSAIFDFNHPPFILIGEMDERAGDLLAELYYRAGARIIRTDPDSACLVKYASNAFHALKVVFANEIGQICKQSGVDGVRVMEIFCEDRQLNISPGYLRPGFSFGGSCLPKDLRALQYLARHQDLHLPVLESILASNHLHLKTAIDLILQNPGRRVGIIGLTFKPGTDDLRESPLVELAEALIGKGLQVRIFDDDVCVPRLVGRNKWYIEQAIPHLSHLMCSSIEELVFTSDVIVVARHLDGHCCRLLYPARDDQLVLDLVRAFSPDRPQPGTYQGICW